MRIIIIAVIIATLGSKTFARNYNLGAREYQGSGGSRFVPYDTSEMDAENENYEEQKYQEAYALLNEDTHLLKIYSRDTWRNINGTTNIARGKGWYEFQGVPQKIGTNGVIFMGDYGIVLSIDPIKYDNNQVYYGEKLFFVENFRYDLNQSFTEMMAHADGLYTTTNAYGQTISIPKFDYGIPCEKVWSPQEIAAMKEEEEKRKQAIADRILKSNQALADKGDAYGLKRMGERYRDGDGVPKDSIKAKFYLERASEAGSLDASNELSKLTISATAKN